MAIRVSAKNLDAGKALKFQAVTRLQATSFDLSAFRTEKRLRRCKRRIKDRNGEGETRLPSAAAESASAIIEPPDEEEIEAADEDHHPVVIAETAKRPDRLTVRNAAIELDLAGAPALVFRHAGHGRVNVVYRRHDSSIGWVDPPLDDADDPGRRLAMK